ncbi:MAG TPA: fumarylacetoacetate hydrolase family protein [Solirubrobacteraceae bacterium]|jgi:2-keto-4-pentenoate hydratase/2-oxohepta-3-ene-1,7-dioic acid hydratase in catechol pathway|nr:fumarylacetoacetate hydrolase family protein [Solirubrobacteraceae bacterium]
MRLATFVAPGRSIPVAGEIRDGRAIAFGSGGESVVDRLANASLEPADGDSWPLDDVDLLAPVPAPRAIFGIGLNYRAHAAEQGAELPDRPIVFLKLPSSAAPPNGAVRCPDVVRRLDYEGELAVVIGSAGRVAGYAVADDVSARDLQGRESQWTRAKGADGFCPYGPWITTADEIPDPHALGLRTWVNGDLRQDGTTGDMIFRIPDLIAFIAETCTLMPGDLILTGTPSGVGMSMDPRRFLASGDTVRIEIDRLGAIEHRIA